jgi:hypothetical protein
MKNCLWLVVLLLVALAAGAAESVKFTITGDSRGAPGFLTVAEQIKAVAGGPGEFMLTPGDDDPPPTTRQHLDKAFGAEFEWFPVIGNHDLPGLPYLREYFQKRLKAKVTAGPAGTRETTYSFDAGPVHIAVINAYWNGKTEAGSDSKTSNLVVAPLRKWLAADLKASRQPWKLVAGHPPAFPQPDKDWHDTRHLGESLDQHPTERDAFWALLAEQHVSAYICGHTHRYSRTQPADGQVWQIDAAQARGDLSSWKYDTFVVVTGNGQQLEFKTYRSLQSRGHFAVTDTLKLTVP